jgi:hypothetical protein
MCFSVRRSSAGYDTYVEDHCGNDLSVLLSSGLFTNSRSMTANGLIPEATCMFQARAVGGSTGAVIGSGRCRACECNPRSLPTRAVDSDLRLRISNRMKRQNAGCD